MMDRYVLEKPACGAVFLAEQISILVILAAVKS